MPAPSVGVPPSTLLDNPFTPHAPAPTHLFVGRHREVDLIFGHLTAQQRGNVAVSGPLGTGKSSLLARIADPAIARRYGMAPPTHVIVYVDVQSVTPFTNRRFWRRIAHLLRRTEGIGLEAAIADLLAREDPDIIDLEEFLDAAAAQGSALVLLLDEFEWALHADTAEDASERRNFLAQLASLTRRSPRVLSLVVATEAPLVEAMRVVDAWRGSPFPTIFTSVALRPLTPDDARALLARTVADGATMDTERDAETLFTLSEGHPGMLQAAAFALYHGRHLGLEGDALFEAARAAVGGVRASHVSGATAGDPVGSAASDAEATGIAAATTSTEEDAGAGLTIDARSGDVIVDGRRVDSLTALEYNLLRLLVEQPGRLCSKSEIIRLVWGEEAGEDIDDSRVEKLVSRLRRKIEPIPGRPQYVRTVRGRGYRYVPSPGGAG